LAVSALALGSLSLAAVEAGAGTLHLTIKDAATGRAVPARIEVRAADGSYRVASDALRVGGDCDMSDRGAGFVDLASTLAGFSDRIHNPYAMATQFYSDGSASLELPAGRATIRVFKGPEYEIAVENVEVPSVEDVAREIALVRWIDMPARGWYGADDHLHIPRPVVELNPILSKMMQAEDIHVANLLEMGKVKNAHIAAQHAHGPKGHYREGNYILAAGQENPRTHFLGHTITLGAPSLLFDAEHYLIYRRIWQEAAKHGALNGFAHAYTPDSFLGTRGGMAVVAPHRLLHFAEVLQFNRGGYEAWYELLALGFRVTPTAGTDYPCAGQTIPGHERFYTQVDGALTYAKWLESVRQGRTFVTTGPMAELSIDGKPIGSELVLESPASVTIAGKVSFDPEQDALAFLELVQNGEPVARFSRVRGEPEIAFRVSRSVDETSWFALRGYGARPQEDPARLGSLDGALHFGSFEPTSNVHTAPIYVTLKDHPGLAQSPRAKRTARAWLARLQDLETLLAEENLAFLAAHLSVPDFDAVPAETLGKNRQELLREIRVAKEFFVRLAQ
jgi:hypothetical protein